MASLLQDSPLDSGRFHRRIARAAVSSPEQVRALDAEARERGIDMMIVRCPATQLAVAQALEGAGFLLMDTLLYYEARTSRFEAPPALAGVVLDTFRPGDEPALEAVAREAFRGYRGHYHTDPRLDPDAATEGYVEWCLRSTTNAAITVVVARQQDQVAGFLTLRAGRDREPAEIELNGVAPWAQRGGLYSAMVRQAGWLARGSGVDTIVVSTQVDNLAPQKVWVRQGFEPQRAYYTFHRWLQPA